MDSFPYWSDNWFATHHIQKNFARLKDQVKEVRAESAADLRSAFAAIEQLEKDVGRALLKLHALVGLLEEKGLVTATELADRARDLDAMDGEEDGVLHPAVFRTEQEQNQQPSPRAFLLLLKQAGESPREFLAGLEKNEEPEPPA